jgi:hypothetical protein
MPEPFSLFLTTFWQIFKNWWWVFLPFILWKPFIFLYLWWRNEEWIKKQRMVVLEIKLPKEVLKPIRAMENVMANLHGVVYHPPDWWEKWIDGQIQLSISFEIASIGGEPHFFVRTGAAYRDGVESSIYSQYPEAEITEVDDYTKYVPQNIPNKDWDLWASDYKLLKDDHYPIKTYPKFETETEKEEEKRVDPVASLLEAMAKIKPGEQLWIQIIAEPISEEKVKAWIAKGEELRDKIARRPAKLKQKPMIQEAAEVLITGKPAEAEKVEEKEIIPPEMKLTPGEREILKGLEEKISKPAFVCTVRFIYLGKREIWFKPNFRLAFSYFNSYTTLNLNALFPLGKTLTKIHKSWFLPLNLIRPRRHYLRCRKIFKNYIKRFPPFFPRKGGTFVLNTEELASLFHFPGEAAAPAPGVPRIEAKKRGRPSELPVE